jgi:hypothetical protein
MNIFSGEIYNEYMFKGDGDGVQRVHIQVEGYGVLWVHV